MAKNDSLKGKKIVLTGKFKTCARKDAEALLKTHGATTASSVSAKTDLVIAGPAAGSKLYDAYRLGVPILAEAHMQLLLGGTPLAEVITLARTFYTLEFGGAATPGSLAVRGGLAPGVGAKRWPMAGERPMDHLFTLDLDAMPALASQYPGHRALSVFCSSADVTMYDIARPGNGLTAIVFTTQAEVDEAAAPPPGMAGKTGEPIRATAHGWDRLEHHFGGTRVLGGVPSWCQQEEHQGNFIMQGGESLGISGDGLVYVFDDKIFAQFT